ncbi:5'-nucleotidase [Nocardioides sp. DS6]|uniref:5'-nucleotidase n=1 Tax=Nocardioides eburneus TaxID=3231482 RepID=A0ABV3SYE6_9ACTN
MAYNLDDRLVIGVASSALFDLAESDAYFREHGEEAYRRYQEERIDDALRPGVAFPFTRRLLGLNDLRPDDPLVEVIVLSRNDPNTGLRVMRSIERHKLPMTRAVFTQGRSPHKFIGALSMSLFLSGNGADVVEAIRAGFPAGHVLRSAAEYDEDDPSLVVAFDFDGVLSDDGSERVYEESGIEKYMEHEASHKDEPLAPGPLQPLLKDLNRIQKLEERRKLDDASYEPRLRIALVTARNAPAHERAIHSMREWDVNVNDAFFLGGIEKAKVLEVLRPHIFFDDQTSHLDTAVESIAGVHIPYGVAYEVAAKERVDIAVPAAVAIELADEERAGVGEVEDPERA